MDEAGIPQREGQGVAGPPAVGDHDEPLGARRGDLAELLTHRLGVVLDGPARAGIDDMDRLTRHAKGPQLGGVLGEVAAEVLVAESADEDVAVRERDALHVLGQVELAPRREGEPLLKFGRADRRHARRQAEPHADAE